MTATSKIMAKDSNRDMQSHKSNYGDDKANSHEAIHNYDSKYNDDMVIQKVQISAVVHQQNDETKMNETNKKTDRLIGIYMLVISFNDDFNHDEGADDFDDDNDGVYYIRMAMMMGMSMMMTMARMMAM